MTPFLILVIVEVIVAALALVFGPSVYLRKAENLSTKERIELSLEIRKMIVSASGVLLVISAAVGTWREFRFEEYKDFGRQTVAAMKLLDSKSEAARIGGVVALERVIEDSERDSEPLVRALVTVLDQWTSKKNRPNNEALNGVALSAFRVIGKHQARVFTSCAGIEFSNLNLQSVSADKSNFSKCSFADVNFASSVLSSVNFAGTTMAAVSFDEADLRGAVFDGANFFSVTFRGADIRGASFLSVKGLNAEQFRGALIEGAKFPDGVSKELEHSRGGHK